MQNRFVSISGGADSTALALYLWEKGEDFELLFCDTGAEFPENYEIIHRLSELTGKKLNIVESEGFYYYLMKFELIPSRKVKWCYRYLKNIPIKKFLKQFNDVIIYVGYRADENKRAANFKDDRYVYPLLDAGFTKNDVIALCKKYDLLNPVYEWRSSISCFCCPFQRKSDWIGLLQNKPDLFDLAMKWEEEINARGKKQKYFGFLNRPLRELKEIWKK